MNTAPAGLIAAWKSQAKRMLPRVCIAIHVNMNVGATTKNTRPGKSVQ
jgi:hypothetical protein